MVEGKDDGAVVQMGVAASPEQRSKEEALAFLPTQGADYLVPDGGRKGFAIYVSDGGRMRERGWECSSGWTVWVERVVVGAGVGAGEGRRSVE